MSICSNCASPIKVLATVVPDGKGGVRHAEKCGPEIARMTVQRSKKSRIIPLLQHGLTDGQVAKAVDCSPFYVRDVRRMLKGREAS